MKAYLFIITLLISVSVNAMDKCNPYVSKPIRETIMCDIERIQEFREPSQRAAYISTGAVKRRRQLIEALDAGAISPYDASVAFKDIDSQQTVAPASDAQQQYVDPSHQPASHVGDMLDAHNKAVAEQKEADKKKFFGLW
jgi:hypothetical protein